MPTSAGRGRARANIHPRNLGLVTRLRTFLAIPSHDPTLSSKTVAGGDAEKILALLPARHYFVFRREMSRFEIVVVHHYSSPDAAHTHVAQITRI